MGQDRLRIATDSSAAVGQISKSQFIGEIFTALGLGGALALLVDSMLKGRTELGSLVAVAFALTWGVSLVGSLAEALRLVRENGAFLGDIFTFEHVATQHHRIDPPVTGRSSAPMRISLDSVSFRYPESQRDVVSNVTMEIQPGEHIALLGANGAGKSTLVRLITGLYQPTQGHVLQDGQRSTSNRQDIGAVFQDLVRWQLPLRDNVGFGNVQMQMEDAEILKALEMADIDTLPLELEDGLDSWLGREFGNRDLSGGQWQRIAIARAFFRDGRLLVLDEPTAALDPLAEQRLFERFHHLASGKTAVTISHRIGPAKLADRIVVMNEGAIVEIGTHDSLMEIDGLYASMYRAQAEWYLGDTEADTE